jgi:L-threonylcarbamoyladenylate synthase
MRMVRVDPEHPDPAVLQEAAAIIRSGGLVAFPTETVYGLGADCANRAAIRRIYEVKGRPERKPLLVLIADRSWLSCLTPSVPDRALGLMDAFWPGPLTLTFPAAPSVPRELLGDGTTIGIRLPGPSVAQALVRTVGGPVTAPSANRSGGPDPVSATAVRDDIGDRIDLILDGGAARQATPSTVVDLSGDAPRLIREGQVPFDAILRVWRAQA